MHASGSESMATAGRRELAREKIRLIANGWIVRDCHVNRHVSPLDFLVVWAATSPDTPAQSPQLYGAAGTLAALMSGLELCREPLSLITPAWPQRALGPCARR